MPTICPKCGGLNPGCSVCDAPPRRQRPYDRRSASRVTFISLGMVAESVVWPVQGVDVSAWNGIMDFSITKTKCQYAVVRLGYGNGWKDSRCDEYRRDLIANDMPYMGYWFCKAGENHQAHASAFAEIGSEFGGIIAYEEDYEYSTLGKIETLTWIINLDTGLKTLINIKTSPYSNKNFWDGRVAPNNYFTEEQWVANWTDGVAPWMPTSWTWRKGCKWQWEADGNGKAHEYGMIESGDVDMDLNRYYGTVEEFNTRYGTHILPIGQVAPPPTPTEFMMKSLYNGLRVREGPGIAYNIVGQLNAGQQVALKNIGGSAAWMQIKSGPYVGKWCAVQTSTRYMEPVE